MSELSRPELYANRYKRSKLNNQRWSRGHKARGQGQGHKKISRPRPRTDLSRPRPRTQTQAFSKKKRSSKIFFRRSQKKKGLEKFFSGEKGLQKTFFMRSLLDEIKKKDLCRFSARFWRFPTKFQRFKNSAVLEPMTGQFSRSWGFEAKAKAKYFKMCPRGQGRSRGLHLCK